MGIPQGYSYRAMPGIGSGYWKADGSGPYSFNGVTMCPQNRYNVTASPSQVSTLGVADFITASSAGPVFVEV